MDIRFHDAGGYTLRFSAAMLVVIGYLGFVSGVCAADGKDVQAISYKKMIQPIFNANCVFCHVTGAKQAGLTLEPGLSPRSLVSVKSTESPLLLVAPGKPNESYLMHKLEGTHIEVGGTGASMPFSAEIPQKLAAKDLALIRRWIASGAPNN